MTEKDFSLRLAKLREEKGVSARDMSLSMGQNPGYINNIESGKSMPSLSGIFYICEYLGITPKDFFDIDAARITERCRFDSTIKMMASSRVISRTSAWHFYAGVAFLFAIRQQRCGLGNQTEQEKPVKVRHRRATVMHEKESATRPLRKREKAAELCKVRRPTTLKRI